MICDHKYTHTCYTWFIRSVFRKSKNKHKTTDILLVKTKRLLSTSPLMILDTNGVHFTESFMKTHPSLKHNTVTLVCHVFREPVEAKIKPVQRKHVTSSSSLVHVSTWRSDSKKKQHTCVYVRRYMRHLRVKWWQNKSWVKQQSLTRSRVRSIVAKYSALKHLLPMFDVKSMGLLHIHTYSVFSKSGLHD